MGKVIKIKNTFIGEGKPKIIVPIVDKTSELISAKVATFDGMPVDAVEWRADFYEDIFDTSKVLETAKMLRIALPEIPLLFTFRTKNEGGEKAISMDDYTALNKAVAQSGTVDMIDVEIFSGDDVVLENIKNIQQAGVFVVASNHDFAKTPDKEELVARLKKMQDMGADILKIAMMPKTEEDVLTLLAATNEMHTKYANQPIISMSMSARGLVSRIAGETFGSCMTFGAIGQVSAPGQISLQKLATILDILHESKG